MKPRPLQWPAALQTIQNMGRRRRGATTTTRWRRRLCNPVAPGSPLHFRPYDEGASSAAPIPRNAALNPNRRFPDPRRTDNKESEHASWPLWWPSGATRAVVFAKGLRRGSWRETSDRPRHHTSSKLRWTHTRMQPPQRGKGGTSRSVRGGVPGGSRTSCGGGAMPQLRPAA